MHNEKKFSEIEVGSVFRFDNKMWQKVLGNKARDLNPPPPMEFTPDTVVETLYEHKNKE